MKRFAPASVLVSNKGDILYTSGRTGKYLEPAAGKANWNIFAMIREGLGYALNNAFPKAVRESVVITIKSAVVKTNGETQTVNIIVQPLEEPEALHKIVLIVFTEVTMPQKSKVSSKADNKTDKSGRVSELEDELRQANQEIKNLRDELSRTNNDMKNLLESTNIATLFLDNTLRVRRFTTKTAKIIKLIPGDVGRKFTDIVSSLHYPELAEDAREVLRTLNSGERAISANDGSYFMVKIMAYRILDDKIDGLVIKFTDISISKNLEASLRQTQADLEKHMVKKDLDLNKAKKKLKFEKHSND